MTSWEIKVNQFTETRLILEAKLVYNPYMNAAIKDLFSSFPMP